MKRKFTIVLALIAILIAITVLWYNTSVHYLKGVDASDVSHIIVFDGNTGHQFVIKSEDDISKIITNIQKPSMKRDGISMFRMGYGFKLSIYNEKDKLIDKFIISSKNTIRDDPFFYRYSSGSLCFDYLKELETKLIKYK